MSITFKILDADTVPQYLDAIADLRLSTFSQYPYLFACQNRESDKKHIGGYMTHPDGRVMIFCDEQDDVVAVCASCPLMHEGGQGCSLSGQFIKKLPWSAEKIKQSYYIGDVIVRPEYQDARILRKLVQYGEGALSERGYKYVTFITANHPKNHPLRPQGYRDLNEKFDLLGYHKLDLNLTATYDTFQPDGSFRKQENPIAFWVKDLQVAPSLLRQVKRHAVYLREQVGMA